MVILAPGAPTIPYQELMQKLTSAKSGSSFYKAVTNAPFDYALDMAFLFLGFMTLYVVDAEAGVVRLVSASDTEHYNNAMAAYPKVDMEKYQVPLSSQQNSIVKVVTSGQPVETSDWASLRRPGVPTAHARANQANSGIAHSSIRPLDVPGGAAMMFAFYQYRQDLGQPQLDFMDEYCRLVSAAMTARKA